MKKIILILIVIIQVNLLLAQNNDKVFPWGDFTWNEVKCVKIEYARVYKDSIQNYPLFLDNDSTTTNSLIEIIVNGIEDGKILAFRAGASDAGAEFEENMTLNDVHKILGQRSVEKFVETDDGYKKVTVIEPYDLNQVESFILKEAWVYDNSDNLMTKQILGICPVKTYYRAYDVFKEEPLFYKLFWVYFPEIENLLSQTNIKDDVTLDSFLSSFAFSSLLMSSEDYWKDYTAKENGIVEYFNSLYLNADNYLNDNEKEVLLYNSPDESVVAVKSVYKRIWNDPENNEIFLPESPLLGNVSLIDFLLEEIFNNNNLKVYSSRAADQGQEYVEEMTIEDVYSEMGGGTEIIVVENLAGEYDTVSIQIPINNIEVTSYILHELEFYNSKGEVVQTRIIGICPVRRFYRAEDFEELDPLYKKIFWVYYPDFQKLAANNYVSKLNCDKSETYDEYFFNNSFVAYGVEDSLIARYPAIYDSLYYDYAFNHFYYNIYSDYFNTFDFAKEINVLDVPQINYSKKAKYKSAKIVYTQISAQGKDSLLFKPDSPIMGYKSIADVIIDAVTTKGQAAYKNEDLSKPLTTEQVLSLLGQKIDTLIVENDLLNGYDTFFINVPYYSDEIDNLLLKELWLFDKDGNVTGKRIMAINLIRTIYEEEDYDQLYPMYRKSFWINYPDFVDEFQQNYIYQYNFSLPNTFNNYFTENKYSYDLIQEQTITKKEAKKNLKLFKRK